MEKKAISAPRVKDAAATRERVLTAAREEMHVHGFGAASLERILSVAGVTKGALYHHFESKRALGHAVVSEQIGGRVRQIADALVQAPDPLAALKAWVEGPSPGDLRLGCPLNNLAQELSATDESFRECIEEVFSAWRGGIAQALARAQAAGQMRREIDPAVAASFILACFQGTVSLAKSAGDESLYYSNMKLLGEFVGQLRQPSTKERR